MKTRRYYRLCALVFTFMIVLTMTALSGIDKKTESQATSRYYKVQIKVGRKAFKAKLKKNETTQKLVSKMPFSIRMNELNGNEKYYYFDETFAANAQTAGKINAGDIKLYGDNCLVIFYKTFESDYDYTDIGRITKTKDLVEALGKGDVKVKFIKK